MTAWLRERRGHAQASILAAGVLMALAAAPDDAVAQADTSQAAALDEQARTAFAEGDFAGAAARFAQANDIAPRPATKYNEAVAWERAGEPARAADAYQVALTSPGLDPERTAAARERLTELERKVGVLSIPGPEGATATVGHVNEGRVPLRIHLAAGTHEVRIRGRDGSTVVRSVETTAGKVVELLLAVTTQRVAPPPRPQPASTAKRREQAARSADPGHTWGWVAVGGAGVFALGAGYLGLKTLDSLDAYEASGYRDADAQQRTQRYKLWTNVAWGAAAVSGAIGVVLLLSDGESGEQSASTSRSGAHVRLTVGGVAAGYTF